MSRGPDGNPIYSQRGHRCVMTDLREYEQDLFITMVSVRLRQFAV